MKYLCWHLGLGDMIMCAGLVVKLAETDDIVLPVPKRYMASLKSFFPGTANVQSMPVESHEDVWAIAKDNSKECVKLGMFAGMNGSIYNNVRELFYLHAGVDPNVRWTHNPLPEAAKFVEQVPLPSGDFIFIHDDAAPNDPLRRGFRIRPEYFKGNYMHPHRKEEHLSILRYADALTHAREIHVIDSCFFHLAESLPIKGKVFLHSYARPSSVVYTSYRRPFQAIT